MDIRHSIQGEDRTGIVLRLAECATDPRNRYITVIAARSSISLLFPKADQAVQIIRSKAADHDDEVGDLGRVAGLLVQAFKLAPGEFLRVNANYKPQGPLTGREPS